MKDKRLLLILLGIVAVAIFAPARTAGGMDVDSCNYAVVAKEILRSNQWIKLYDPVYGGPFYYHFPLALWVTAIFFKLFGVSTFVAKLFSMLCAAGLVAAVFYLGKLLRDEWLGFFGGLALLFTNHIIRLSMQSRMDIPVTFFITLAFLAFILAEKQNRLYYLLFGLFNCLAIFTKDVTGTAALAIVFIYLAIRWKWKELIHPLFIAGLVVTFAPLLLWAYLDKGILLWFWWKTNFLHLLRSCSASAPWYYYPQALLKKYFYFLPFLFYGTYLAIQEVRRQKKGEFLLLIIWFIFLPFAFSFGRQKLYYFILPIFPAASLLVGLALTKLIKERIRPKVAGFFKAAVLAGVFVTLSFPLPLRSKYFIETQKIAPFLDEILKKNPDWEFIVYRQDKAALLFYSQTLTRLNSIENIADLEQVYGSNIGKKKLCYLSEKDFLGLAASIKENSQALLKYKDKLLLLNEKGISSPVAIP